MPRSDCRQWTPAHPINRVAAFDRKRWPLWIGLGGRLPSESLAALPRIPHLPKIAPRYARYTRQPPAGSLPSRRSVACTIATNVAPRELYRRTHRGHVSTRAPFRLYNRMPQMQWRKDHLHGIGSQQRPVVLVNQSQLITHELFEEAIPRPDRVLSRDRQDVEGDRLYDRLRRREKPIFRTSMPIGRRNCRSQTQQRLLTRGVATAVIGATIEVMLRLAGRGEQIQPRL